MRKWVQKFSQDNGICDIKLLKTAGSTHSLILSADLSIKLRSDYFTTKRNVQVRRVLNLVVFV